MAEGTKRPDDLWSVAEPPLSRWPERHGAERRSTLKGCPLGATRSTWDPLLGDRGREDVKQTIAEYREAFPDLAFTIKDVVAADDKVVVRWRAEGTFENEFMGQEPTHEKGEPVEGIGIDRLEDGRVAESWGQWDTTRFIRNIGAVPDAAEALSA
ncbi:MAG: ester cyclase [Solirubrobacterales bacterium]